ncbi:MAG: LysM peptidoglycan-binding domain-containing protein [Lewinellaceae bacterium]|nr:LysM peptidoglycan-binding domain-containing protein [Lewinellaceae bacterium]
MKTYTVKKGDSLWKIAEREYGNGFYWKAIKDANPKWVGEKGLIVTGSKLQLPHKSLLKNGNTSGRKRYEGQSINGKAREALSEAAGLLFPKLTLDEQIKPRLAYYAETPSATIVIKARLKGKLEYQKKGNIGDVCSFNIKNHKAECTTNTEGILNRIEYRGIDNKDGKTLVSFGLDYGKLTQYWEGELTYSPPHTFKAKLAPKPIRIESPDILVSGNIGLEVEIKVIPKNNLKLNSPERRIELLNEAQPIGFYVVIIGIVLVLSTRFPPVGLATIAFGLAITLLPGLRIQ